MIIRDPQEDKIIWEIPFGRMNINEEPREAVTREIMEELGIDMEVGKVEHLEQFMQGNNGKRSFVIVYGCHMKYAEPPIVMSETEVCNIVWVAHSELLKYPLFPEYKRALDYYFANKV